MSTAAPVVRESGFYWVRETLGGLVFVARWQDHVRAWLIAGVEGGCADHMLEVVSARLTPPD